MTPTHHAREGDLLWDYPGMTHPIVGILAIAACFGIGVTLLKAAYFNELWFAWGFGLIFIFVLTDVGYFFMHRVPRRPRALSDWAGHDGVVLDRERREREMEHRIWRSDVEEREENLPIRSATQRVIVVFLIGSTLGVVPSLVRERMGALPGLMLTVEQALCVVVSLAATIAAWPILKSLFDQIGSVMFK